MKLRDLVDVLTGKKKAVSDAPAIWKRKKCKSCIIYGSEDCPTNRQYRKRGWLISVDPLRQACEYWKGKK